MTDKIKIDVPMLDELIDVDERVFSDEDANALAEDQLGEPDAASCRCPSLFCACAVPEAKCACLCPLLVGDRKGYLIHKGTVCACCSTQKGPDKQPHYGDPKGRLSASDNIGPPRPAYQSCKSTRPRPSIAGRYTNWEVYE